MLSALALLLVVGSNEPWHCPPDICVNAAREAPPAIHGRTLRRMMQAFGPLRGRQPALITALGTPLARSMSVSQIERRLRRDEAGPAFRVLYGRCASHDEDCPSVDIELRLHAQLDAIDCDAPTVTRVTRTASHLVVEHRPEGPLESFEVAIGPGRCVGDPPPEPAPDPERMHSVSIYIEGTHGLGRRALGQLPVRAIARALGRTSPPRS